MSDEEFATHFDAYRIQKLPSSSEVIDFD